MIKIVEFLAVRDWLEASFTEADTTRRRLEALIREALESAEVALEVAE